MVYKPDENLEDGAAEVASRGLFDVWNVPPWDTWVEYVVEDLAERRSYLLSWVPGPLVDIVDAGIQANPEFCILWAKDMDTPVIDQLRKAGLVGPRHS